VLTWLTGLGAAARPPGGDDGVAAALGEAHAALLRGLALARAVCATEGGGLCHAPHPRGHLRTAQPPAFRGARPPAAQGSGESACSAAGPGSLRPAEPGPAVLAALRRAPSC
jgi:hypothetical protein